METKTGVIYPDSANSANQNTLPALYILESIYEEIKMKLWKLMVSAIIVSVFMIWACAMVDNTAQAAEQTEAVQHEIPESYYD
jgi:hypothetical protein